MVYDISMRNFSGYDSEIVELIESEEERQRNGLELIPSENYVSSGVLEALGTVYTNKYSEGYPGRRYYGGQEYTDQVEQLAIDRAKQLFNSDHANVQPHSGAPANLAVYAAWCEPGDTILAMDLSHGGHLTHGHPVTFPAKVFNFVRYGMKDVETGAIDYEQVYELAKKHQPKIILAGFSAYPRELDYQRFADIADEVGALAMADMAHIAGLIAGGAAENPFDYGFHVVTSTTHKTLRGPRGGLILSNGTVGNPLKRPDATLENIPTLIDRTVFPGLQGGPHMNNTLAKAVAFGEAQQPAFAEYAKAVVSNARALASALQARGFRLITGGTDNHLLLVDVYTSFGVSGGEAETALDAIGLNANKNVLPDDERKAYDPSGLRIGTPALTTRGMDESDMERLADWMHQAVTHTQDETKLQQLAREVQNFAQKYPLPSDESAEK